MKKDGCNGTRGLCHDGQVIDIGEELELEVKEFDTLCDLIFTYT